MRYITLIALIALMAAIIICATILHVSPIQKAFDGAIEAVNSHDYPRFCRYVDTHRLIKSYVDLQERENPMKWAGQSSYLELLDSRLQYFIETEHIPNSDRFKKLINPHIIGKQASVSLVLDIKKYSVICTTSVNLQLTDSGWQIDGIDLQKIWERVTAIRQSGKGKIDPALIQKWQNTYGILKQGQLQSNIDTGQQEAVTPATLILAIIYDTENNQIDIK
jgi:hypothetical protein